MNYYDTKGKNKKDKNNNNHKQNGMFDYFDSILDNDFNKPSVVLSYKSSKIKDKKIEPMEQKVEPVQQKKKIIQKETNEEKPSKGRYDAFMNDLLSYDKLTPLKKEDKIIYQQLMGNKNRSKIDAEGAINKLRIKRQMLYPD